MEIKKKKMLSIFPKDEIIALKRRLYKNNDLRHTTPISILEHMKQLNTDTVMASMSNLNMFDSSTTPNMTTANMTTPDMLKLNFESLKTTCAICGQKKDGILHSSDIINILCLKCEQKANKFFTCFENSSGKFPDIIYGSEDEI